MESLFKQRLGFDGDLKEIAGNTCRDLNLGNFLDCEVIFIGYEDFNFLLTTSNGKFFVKIFSNERTLDDCKRNVNIIEKVLEAGVNVPKLYGSKQGFLRLLEVGRYILRICVMDFIDGRDFFTSKRLMGREDVVLLAHQASLINSINIKPPKIYDSWAISNFLQEFEAKGQYLEKEDFVIIKPLCEKFKELNIKTLPHSFVHGDIIKTNIIKDKNDKIWVVDFSVSNYYPRIQELAVLACDVLFDENNAEESEQNLVIALEEYQRKITLTQRELESLPIYIKLAHAMHVLRANFEKKVKNNNSEENNYFLRIGKSGLRQLEPS